MNIRSIFPRYPRPRSSRLFGATIAFVVLVALPLPWVAGIRTAFEAELYPVSGKVTVDNIAPVGAVVRLRPLQPPSWLYFPPSGTVSDDGTFQIKTLGFRNGASIGKYAVTIAWQPVRFTDNGPAAGANVLSSRFESVRTTPLFAEVTRGPNELPPFVVTCSCCESSRLSHDM